MAIAQTEQGTPAYPGRARTLADWLAEYGESHQHPWNKRLHWICVPLIVLSLLGMLAAIPVPASWLNEGHWLSWVPGLNWAVIAALAAVAYYFTLSRPLALASLLVLGLLLAGVQLLGRLPWPLALSSAVIFVLAWIGQFVGHAIEGRRPSFFKDLQFLLIGPLWLLASAGRRLRGG